MYICLNCNNVFAQPNQYEERHGFTYGQFEKIYRCPYCDDNEFVETYRCESCGQWIDTDTYVEIDERKYCENCFTINSLQEY
jgi:hypothetical protein